MATVLLVDDDAESLAALAAMVQSGGHHVLQASSGTDALDILDRDIAVDLLLTDVVMPGLNGFNLARMARTRRRDLRVLYVTASYAMAMRDGGHHYGKLLCKPILADGLRSELDAALAAPPGADADRPR